VSASSLESVFNAVDGAFDVDVAAAVAVGGQVVRDRFPSRELLEA